MKKSTFVAIALAVATIGTATTHAVAGTDADNFRTKIEKKIAPPFGTIGSGKFKGLCVCNSTDHIGALETFNGIPNLGLTCTVPNFNSAGEYTSGSACYDWTPLTK